MANTRGPIGLVGRTGALEEGLAAIQGALAVEERIARGEEELIPANEECT